MKPLGGMTKAKIDTDEVSKSIILKNNLKQGNTAVVVDCGPDVEFIEIGQRILFSKGNKTEEHGEHFVYVHEDDILATLT